MCVNGPQGSNLYHTVLVHTPYHRTLFTPIHHSLSHLTTYLLQEDIQTPTKTYNYNQSHNDSNHNIKSLDLKYSDINHDLHWSSSERVQQVHNIPRVITHPSIANWQAPLHTTKDHSNWNTCLLLHTLSFYIFTGYTQFHVSIHFIH